MTTPRWRLHTVREVDEGSVRIVDEADNCSADGLRMPPLVPIWAPAAKPDSGTARVPCFGVAIAGVLRGAVRGD